MPKTIKDIFGLICHNKKSSKAKYHIMRNAHSKSNKTVRRVMFRMPGIISIKQFKGHPKNFTNLTMKICNLNI